jgi:transcriptional regulator with XRE-family HTH domain
MLSWWSVFTKQEKRMTKVSTTSEAVLGAVLVALRKGHSVNQAAVANAVGVGASTWSRIEKGESTLSVGQLRAAAKFLSETPASILEKAEKFEHRLQSDGVSVEERASQAAFVSSVAGVMASQAGATMIPLVGSALFGLISGYIKNRKV